MKFRVGDQFTWSDSKIRVVESIDSKYIYYHTRYEVTKQTHIRMHNMLEKGTVKRVNVNQTLTDLLSILS